MLSLSLLGSPQIQLGGQKVNDLTSAKAQALLFYLALKGRSQSRLHLAGLLWPEKSDQEARLNLRQTIFLLRHSLPNVIAATRETIQLEEDLSLEIDVHEFETEIQAGLAGEIDSLRSAIDCYNGDFLTGFYVEDAPEFSEWVLIEREHLRSLMIQGLVRLSEHYVKRGETSPGILYTGKLLTLEPWREESHRQMMRLLAWDGQIQGAIAQYEQCRQLLADELDLEPSTETIALLQQIQSGTIERFTTSPAVADVPSSPIHIVEWGDAPALMPMHGREIEMEKLTREVLERKCRLVGILGIGGQGKTTLASNFARTHDSAFEVLLWRTLLNAPFLDDILQNWLERLSPGTTSNIPQNLDEKLDLFFSHLGQKRCLFILDNAESIMEAGKHAGAFRAGYESYEQLLRRFALGDHQSCLLLTSREKPKHFSALERQQNPVFSLSLSGLKTIAGRAILQEENLSGSETEMETLVRKYSGNPLALILIADTINDLYAGNVSAFLEGESPIFANIQEVLAQQLDRLTELEVQIMLWLAIERETVDISLLDEQITLSHTKGELLTALRSLERRSLIEKREINFTLQNVLMEFVTDYLVASIVKELLQDAFVYFAQFPLLKAQAKSYIRITQEHLLLKPVAEQLANRAGVSQAVALLKERLSSLSPSVRQYSYAGGNILNLLLHLGVEEALDFSGAAVWQAFLRGKDLPPIDFSGADLTGAAFTDYGGYILTLALSPDGTRLVGSAISGELRMWDVATRQPLLTFDGHQDFAGAVCFSPDGRFLASGGGDGVVCLWDAETGRRLHTFPVQDNGISSVVYAPDGSWIAGASSNHLTVWDPVSGDTLFSQKFEGGFVNALAVNHSGDILAFSNHNIIFLWDIPKMLATGEEQLLHEFHDHQAWVRRLAFSSDGQWLAGSGDGVHVWDVATGQRLQSFTIPNSLVDGIAFHPQNDILAVGSQNTIYLWSMKTGKLLRAFAAHEEMIVSLVFSLSGKILISSSEDHTVRFWNLDGQNLHTIQEYVNMIHGVNLSPDGRFMACGSDDREVRLWDFQSRELVSVLSGHQSRVHCVLFSPDGRKLATSSRDRLVHVWDIPSCEERYKLPTGGVPYHALAWSRNGQWLATGDRDGVMTLWDAETGHRLQSFSHQTRVNAVAFHPDGQHAAAGCLDEKIYIWDLDTHRCTQTLSGHLSEIWTLAYTPDGRFLISGSDDCTVRFWDTDTGECKYTLDNHKGWIQTLDVSYDGELLVTGSQDRTICLWELKQLDSGKAPRLIRTLTGHRARVTDVCFTPDASTIVSSSLDETMHLWNVGTGDCLEEWLIPGPYAFMDITGATGLTTAQRRALTALGAFEKAQDQ